MRVADFARSSRPETNMPSAILQPNRRPPFSALRRCHRPHPSSALTTAGSNQQLALRGVDITVCLEDFLPTFPASAPLVNRPQIRGSLDPAFHHRFASARCTRAHDLKRATQNGQMRAKNRILEPPRTSKLQRQQR